MSGTQVERNLFNSLPPEAIKHILQLLPIVDAAKTSILSNEWRYKWLSRPHLILDHNHFYITIACRRNWYLVTGRPSPRAYSKIISNILVRHIGPILEFYLYIPYFFRDDISHWLEFVSRQGIKQLTIHNENEIDMKLPSCLLTCVGFTHLTHLTLINCHISTFPSIFRGFHCLLSLAVDQWNDNSDLHKLEILISYCNQLRNLAVQGISKENLTIQAPNLRELVVYGTISDICLEGRPDVQILSLDVSNSCGSNMVKFFTCVPKIEKLHLKGWHSIFKRWFKEVETLKNPAIEFGLLRTLVLREVPLDSQSTISFVVRLLQGSPLLQTLEIHGSNQRHKLQGKAQECETWDISLEDCSLGYLKNVLVVYTGGFNGALGFMKFVLASSPVLETMIIDVTKSNIKIEEKLDMSSKLLRQRRASTRAEVIFNT